MKWRFSKSKIIALTVVSLIGLISVSVFASGFPFNIHVDGKEIKLNHTLLKEGHTYVQLRELANKMGAKVEWVGFHSAPIPGGNLPEGININQSNVLHTKDISGWFEGKPTMGVEMTSLLNAYNEKSAEHLQYYFKDGSESGLYIKEKEQVQYIPLTFYNDMGLTYVTVDEFRKKVQPYFVDICLQK